jgi:hypothetical protein
MFRAADMPAATVKSRRRFILSPEAPRLLSRVRRLTVHGMLRTRRTARR